MPEDWRQYCREKRADLDPDAVAEDFRDYWVAKPGKDGRKADWHATWCSWVRKEKTRPAASSLNGAHRDSVEDLFRRGQQ